MLHGGCPFEAGLEERGECHGLRDKAELMLRAGKPRVGGGRSRSRAQRVQRRDVVVEGGR